MGYIISSMVTPLGVHRGTVPLCMLIDNIFYVYLLVVANI